MKFNIPFLGKSDGTWNLCNFQKFRLYECEHPARIPFRFSKQVFKVIKSGTKSCFFKIIKTGTKKNVYKNVSSHALKPHLKLLSFTFGTPESDASVLGYLKEEKTIFIDF